MITIALTGVAFLILATVTLYSWRHPKTHFENILLAALGAFVGSMVGRICWVDSWPLHVVSAAGGAFAFWCFDWFTRIHHAPSRSVPRFGARH
jgi:hypothetical protein